MRVIGDPRVAIGMTSTVWRRCVKSGTALQRRLDLTVLLSSPASGLEAIVTETEWPFGVGPGYNVNVVLMNQLNTSRTRLRDQL